MQIKTMNLSLTKKISKVNFTAFIWHGIFLSLASNFMDVHTIIPSILIKAGGGSILLGLLTSIMIGGSGLVQIVFAGFLSNKEHKKKSLILGVNLRIIALLFLSLMIFISEELANTSLIFSIFILISIFSFSGSYANISYVDIMGKSILQEKRKKFFSLKQSISSIGIILSAIAVKKILKDFSYPENYAILFIGAGILLFIASIGFWKINEIPTKIRKTRSFKEYLQTIPKEIANNSNLKNYLYIINYLGLSIGFIPFIILYANKSFGLSNNLIGDFLLYKIIGMMIASLVLYKRSKNFEYKKLLYFSLTLGIFLPVLSLAFSNNIFIYKFIFFLTGVLITVFKISKEGVLVEISDNENRAVYTGISGAGNILPTIFPLIAGFFISILGYTITFLMVSMIISLSIIYIIKLNCKKKDYMEDIK